VRSRNIRNVLAVISFFIFLVCTQPTSLGGGASVSDDSSVEILLMLTGDVLQNTQWNFYTGKDTIIPAANLLENDVNFLNSDPIFITEVGNA